MKLKTVIFFAVILLANSTANAKRPSGKHTYKRPPSPIETVKVSKKVFNNKLSLFGNLHAGKSATVSTEVEGAVIAFDKEVGDKVKKGEVVCRIDDGKYSIAVKSSSGRYEKAKAQKAEAGMSFNRTKSLFEKKIASQKRLDEAELKFRVAKGELSSKQADLLNAKRNLALTKVKAPYTGILAGKFLQKGDWVKAGNKLFDIVDLSSAYILADLPEKELGRAKISSPANIWFDAYKGKTFKGKVTKISPRTSGKSRGFETRIDFVDSDGIAKDGLFARIEIILKERLVLVIPKDAVVERGAMKVVFIVKGKTVKQVKVVIDAQRGDMVEVSGAIKEGDELAVTGNEILRDGSVVNVTLKR